MIIVGLTGSMAMGKSEVAKAFRVEGIPVFDADAEVHALYESPEGASMLEDIVPDAIRMNRVDRELLSAALLREPGLLPKVEKIIHAQILKRREAFIAAARRAGSDVIVLDIPLLFETGGENSVDMTVVVSSSAKHQQERALSRPGMTEEKLAMILHRQMSDAEKRKRADHIIGNDGTIADLYAKVLKLSEILRQKSKNHA